MTTRDRALTVLRGILACLVYAAALAVPPLLITALSQWVPVPELDWFHPNPNADAPPLGEQLRGWLIDSYHTVRLNLDDRARGMLVVIVVLGASWLALVGITLSTLWCWTRHGLDALRVRAASWGPRGWLASLLTTLVLSGTANPAHATTGAQPVATAPHHPHHTASGHGTPPAPDQPVTPGDHSQPPPREPGVRLPEDIRPDCPRYRVQRGDTLTSIAHRELGSIARWHDLARVNAFQLGTNPDRLEPGWVILLPPEAAPPDQGTTTVITVARGDTLWSLSERELGTPNRWGQLWDLNLLRTQPDGLRLSQPDRLQPGWQIVVPDEPHNQPEPGFTPTAPVPSQDPFTIDPWPDPFPPAQPTTPREPGPAASPGQAHPGQPHAPAAPPGPQQGTAPHDGDPQHAPSPVDGIEPTDGVFLGLGLAAAISLALRLARRRHQAKYIPGSPFTDYQPAPTVRALHRAHLAATRDPETDEPRTTDHTHPHEADQTAVRPTPRSTRPPHAPAHTPLPIELGVQQEHTVRLDLASCQGLGLSGPANTDTVRALLLQLLSRHTPREQPPLPVVMTRADANVLLNDVDDPPSTIQLVDDLPEALQLLENARSAAPAAHDSSTQDHEEDAATHTVLVARTPVEHAYQLYTLLRDRHGIAAVLLGPWPDGVTLTLDHHGVITHATPASSHHLAGTRVFTATPQAGGELQPLTPTPRTPLPPTPPPVNLFQLTYGYDPRKTGSSEDSTALFADTPADPTCHETSAAHTETAQASDTPLPATTASTVTPTQPDATSRSHTSDGPAEQNQTPSTADAVHHATSPAATQPDPPRTCSPTAPTTDSQDQDTTPLWLHVFGRFTLTWTCSNGESRDVTDLLGRRHRDLLTYLAVHPHGVSRESLVTDVWGEARRTRPTNALNTLLSRLRERLRRATHDEISEIIDTTNPGRYRLQPGTIASDYGVFTHARRLLHTDHQHTDALRTLMQHYTGALAPHIDAEWIEQSRHDAHRTYLHAVSELAHTHTEHSPRQTLALLEAATEHDPHNETLYRGIMLLQHQLGFDHAIPTTLRALRAHLATIDAEPSSDIAHLAETLTHRQVNQ